MNGPAVTRDARRGDHRSFLRRLLSAIALTVALVLAALPVVPSEGATAQVLVPALRETAPALHTGDAMDDPALWVHPTDPSRSLVIGNDKQGALESYDLTGNRVQRLTSTPTFWGNVDVRQGVTVAGRVLDVVAVSHGGLQLYTVDPVTRLMSSITEGTAIATSGEGLCLYVSPTTQRLYAFVVTIAGRVRQYELNDTDNDGLLGGLLVRDFQVGSEAEGCVADDDTGALYLSEEDVALWRYGAEPASGTQRQLVDGVTSAGGHLDPDIEGLTLVDLPGGGGYLIASAQKVADSNNSYFGVYDRQTGAYVSSFRVTNGAAADDCDRTDGITAVATPLGPDFPQGIFVCQDNSNAAPGTVGNQDFKLVPLQDVVALGPVVPPGPVDPPGPVSTITPVGAVARNANATSWTLTVPADVQTGDGMVLLFSRGTGAQPTGPGADWTSTGTVVDGTLETTVWQRVATAVDAGTSVRVSVADGLRKAALTLAVYRGTRTTVPFASATSAVEPGTSATHLTASATGFDDGAWRLSYWSDRSSAATGWTAPGGELVRSTSAGTGGGRVTSLLTDSGGPVPVGPTSPLAATAAAPSDKATMWTLLLLPAAQPPTGS